MKIISIRQPWAWGIFRAGKDIENRSWATKVRGRVLVHASLRTPTTLDREQILSILMKHPLRWTGTMLCDALDIGPESRETRWSALRMLPVGGIIGSVEIVDCVSHSTSPWFFGPFGFVLRDPRPLPFIRLKGRLGFWNATPDVMAQVQEIA